MENALWAYFKMFSFTLGTFLFIFYYFFIIIIIFNKFILFIYFWLCWVFVVVQGLLIAVASLVAEHGL